MKSVIHKYIVDDRHIGSTFDLALEADARVLYFDRDSRTDQPVLWVLRPAPEINKPLGDLVRRRFLVASTGDDFEVTGTLVPHGLIRIGSTIFHGFEVVDSDHAATDVPRAVAGAVLAKVGPEPSGQLWRTAEDKKRGNEAATLAYREAIASGKTREEAIVISRKAWGEAAYRDHVKDERLCEPTSAPCAWCDGSGTMHGRSDLCLRCRGTKVEPTPPLLSRDTFNCELEP